MNHLNENRIIADFDDRKYKPYWKNNSYDKEFNTFSECLKWINGQSIRTPHAPQLGWNLGFGKYHESWDWLMPVIIKISTIEMPDDRYESGERKYVEYIYPVTFGRKNENGHYMFRFHGYPLYHAETLIEAAHMAVVNVLEHQFKLNDKQS